MPGIAGRCVDVAVSALAAQRSPVRDSARMYQAFRSLPENSDVPLRDALTPYTNRLLARVPMLDRIHRPDRRSQFEEDLRLLNDTLNQSPLSGRWWVWAGLLLGWAREGRVLGHDIMDADFAYSAADDHLFEQAVPVLLAAGFRRWFSFRNNRGEITQHVFIRHGASFEFFRMRDVSDTEREYFVYGTHDGEPIELEARLRRQEMAPFHFLDRIWLKPLDHAAELERNYGTWRRPDPGWSYLDDGAVVARHRWRPQRDAELAYRR